jgi:hypothetical protein
LILKLNHAFKWEFVPSFGLFGIAEMMWFSILQQLLNSYRLYTRRCTRWTCGPFYKPKTNKCIWILDALDWWWSFGLSSTRVVGSLLIWYKSAILYFLFCWLIHAATLGEPWRL